MYVHVWCHVQIAPNGRIFGWDGSCRPILRGSSTRCCTFWGILFAEEDGPKGRQAKNKIGAPSAVHNFQKNINNFPARLLLFERLNFWSPPPVRVVVPPLHIFLILRTLDATALGQDKLEKLKKLKA